MLTTVRLLVLLVPTASIWLTPISHAVAQSSGSRGGLTGVVTEREFPALDVEAAERYIMIEGSSEVRVQPTSIRVVLAVTNESKTANQCQDDIQGVIAALKREWSELKIPAEDIVVDFIAVLPLYEWIFEKTDNREVAIERKAGYRMQTNVHLAVPEEALAQAAVTKAFELGVTDIIAFDYWSAELDEFKEDARERALKAARRKAELLLFSQTDKPLPIINIQERTQVISPEQLYHSFVNSYEDTVERPVRRDLPLVRAYRPRNTYYRGPQLTVDVQARELPMNPQISVIARVRLYFESPAAKTAPRDD